MKILVLGATGMLGQEVVKVAISNGHSVTAFGSKDLDLTDEQAIKSSKALSKKSHDWVINCAAYTAVDKAEEEPEKAWDLNEEAVLNLAARLETGPRLIHISTDFVFNGEKTEPYTEVDEPDPINTYGQTKLGGERYAEAMTEDAIILRTSWLFGAGGSCFPGNMIRHYKNGKHLKIVNDQFGCPTSAVDLANCIVQCLEKAIPGGIYHACGPDIMNWHQFAELAISTHEGSKIELESILTSEYPTPAARPRYSAMSTQKLAKLGISPWRTTQVTVKEFVAKIKTAL